MRSPPFVVDDVTAVLSRRARSPIIERVLDRVPGSAEGTCGSACPLGRRPPVVDPEGFRKTARRRRSRRMRRSARFPYDDCFRRAIAVGRIQYLPSRSEIDRETLTAFDLYPKCLLSKAEIRSSAPARIDDGSPPIPSCPWKAWDDDALDDLPFRRVISETGATADLERLRPVSLQTHEERFAEDDREAHDIGGNRKPREREKGAGDGRAGRYNQCRLDRGKLFVSSADETFLQVEERQEPIPGNGNGPSAAVSLDGLGHRADPIEDRLPVPRRAIRVELYRVVIGEPDDILDRTDDELALFGRNLDRLSRRRRWRENRALSKERACHATVASSFSHEGRKRP